MVYLKDDELYIGSKKTIRNLKTLKPEEYDDSYVFDEKRSKKLSYLLESQVRLFRVIEFLSNTRNSNIKIFGRVFSIVGNKETHKMLKREFFSVSMDELDRNIGHISGDVVVEFVILSEDVDIQELLDYARLCKFRCDIYTIFEIEDNMKFLSLNNLNELKVPDYLIKAINKV